MRARALTTRCCAAGWRRWAPEPWATPPSRCLHDHSGERISDTHCRSNHEKSGLEGHCDLQPSTTHTKQALLRQLLRRTHAAEVAMANVLSGQRIAMHGRPDAAWLEEQERAALADVSTLLLRYRTRPSLLLPLLRSAGLAAGVLAALAPAPARDAVFGALQEAVIEVCNDGLRALREAQLVEQAPEVRALLLRLRDLQRAAEGAPQPPDLLALQRLQSLSDLGVQGAVGALAKAAADAAAAAAGRV